jgi:hypothetical protein
MQHWIVFVSILASFCVWTKSLICKDAANRDSTVLSEVRRISKFPVSHPDDVSSCPDAHLSTVPFVRTTFLSIRTSERQTSFVRTTCFFRPDTYIVSRASVPASSVWTFQQHVRTPISSRTVHWFFPSSRNGRSINRPDNVLIQERFLRENFRKSCRTVVRPDGHGPPSGRLTGLFFLTSILTPSL